MPRLLPRLLTRLQTRLRGALSTYKSRDITYAGTVPQRWGPPVIRTTEWFTGKLRILLMVREFERRGGAQGRAFWPVALDILRIRLTTPEAQIARIPATGPVVLVANHAHGMIDGIMMAELISRVRGDFQIISRELPTGVDDVVAAHLIPAPFPDDPDAQAKSLAMRAAAMQTLKDGGLIALFPAGVVATAASAFGPPVEARWNAFTAQLIRRSGARVVPLHFTSTNSRAYQIANRISPVLRQALMLHEIVHVSNADHAPVIGAPVPEADMARLDSDPRGFVTWLRDHTLSLKN